MTHDARINRTAARLFGIFFILAFASYGAGSGLVASVADNADGLAGIHDVRGKLITGVLLIAIVHSIVNIGLSVLVYPVLDAKNGFLARGYFAAGITATTTAVIGALFLSLLAPLCAAYVTDGTGAPYYDAIAYVLKQGGFYGYQISMTLWGVGGLMLCYALHAYRLVPRLLAVWGGLGYVVFMAGTTAEMFGARIGVMLALPGGLFELTLSVWLILKGFNVALDRDEGGLVQVAA